jgi:hypothetical protein
MELVMPPVTYPPWLTLLERTGFSGAAFILLGRLGLLFDHARNQIIRPFCTGILLPTAISVMYMGPRRGGQCPEAGLVIHLPRISAEVGCGTRKDRFGGKARKKWRYIPHVASQTPFLSLSVVPKWWFFSRLVSVSLIKFTMWIKRDS